MEKPLYYLVLFDGVCALCNSSVKFLVRIDKKKKLRYASLQGETAQALFKRQNIFFDSDNFKSMVLIKNPDSGYEKWSRPFALLKDLFR